MKQEIILIGGGGHCQSCIDVIEQEGKYQIAGILDIPDKVGTTIMGYKIMGSDVDIPKLANKGYCFLITVGQIKSAEKRKSLFEIVKKAGGNLPVIVSPHAYVSKSAEISEGTIVMHHALINANARIGANGIINSKALIEHDAIVGDHCHISTGAIVNGDARIGGESFLGTGATTIHGAVVPPQSFVTANSLYIKK